ncbi:MAG: adenylyltransferase/cytidyltransferase family protein [Patescibacteria group bacterium]
MNNEIRKRSTVLVFGTFDLLHEGHISFLKQAGRFGDFLIAVVARDKTVVDLKSRKPYHGERTRLAAVRKIQDISKAFLGDKILYSYSILKKLKPDIICLGYDQHKLETDLCARMEKGKLPQIKIIRLRAHKPEKFKTSIVARSLLKKSIQSKQ